MTHRITCINKDSGNHENPHIAIQGMGWINDDTGKTGWCTREDMYDFVKQGNYVYVRSGLNKAKLIAEISPRGTKFVKTVPDATKRDNLLHLEECK